MFVFCLNEILWKHPLFIFLHHTQPMDNFSWIILQNNFRIRVSQSCLLKTFKNAKLDKSTATLTTSDSHCSRRNKLCKYVQISTSLPQSSVEVFIINFAYSKIYFKILQIILQF